MLPSQNQAATGQGLQSHSPVQAALPVYLRLLVSNVAAGCIIGRKGTTISQLQQDSGARIHLSRNAESASAAMSSFRVVLVSGSMTACMSALQAMLDFVLNSGAPSQTLLARDGTSVVLRCVGRQWHVSSPAHIPSKQDARPICIGGQRHWCWWCNDARSAYHHRRHHHRVTAAQAPTRPPGPRRHCCRSQGCRCAGHWHHARLPERQRQVRLVHASAPPRRNRPWQRFRILLFAAICTHHAALWTPVRDSCPPAPSPRDRIPTCPGACRRRLSPSSVPCRTTRWTKRRAWCSRKCRIHVFRS